MGLDLAYTSHLNHELNRFYGASSRALAGSTAITAPLGQEQKPRGWCRGSEEFRQELLARLAKSAAVGAGDDPNETAPARGQNTPYKFLTQTITKGAL
jgi:hypothetical protein